MLERGSISHNHKLGVFTVVGTTGNPHVVTLFPTEKCTCASTTHCYHILAARLSVGLEDGKSKRKINLTQLKRNTRSKRDKKSGRKAPRAGDYQITSAPDASSDTQNPSPSQNVPPSLDIPSPSESQSSHPPSLDTRSGHSPSLDTDCTDSEVLMSQLLDSNLLRLWRTGAFTHVYTAAEDEEVDVSDGNKICLVHWRT